MLWGRPAPLFQDHTDSFPLVLPANANPLEQTEPAGDSLIKTCLKVFARLVSADERWPASLKAAIEQHEYRPVAKIALVPADGSCRADVLDDQTITINHRSDNIKFR